MKDFREHEVKIRKLVEKQNALDRNWTWKVKSIGKNKVRIRWGYLADLGEKDDCFIMELKSYSNDDTVYLNGLRPDGTLIEFVEVKDDGEKCFPGEKHMEDALICIVEEIAYCAHNEY